MIVNDQSCPLCGGSNNCKAKATDPSTCWCMEEVISEAILSGVPNESKGKQCICKKCVDTYKAIEI